MNRRSFIKRSLFTLAATGMVPSLFSRTALAAGGNGKILVVFHLFGGNDVLNTLIPYGQSEYADYRPDIKIATADILTLDAPGVTLGLHPALDPLMTYWNNGQLALVNQVGYPHHNRSHFYSTAVWNTADPDNVNKVGWLGPFIDEQNDPFCATNFGSTLPRALRGVHTSGLSIESIGSFSLGTSDWEEQLRNELLRQIQTARSGTAEEVRRGMEHMLRSIEKVQEMGTVENTVTFPSTGPGRRFAEIAKMIKGDFPAQVYYSATGGYDTHSGQGGATGAHANLLSDLAGALDAFMREMSAIGKDGDVMVLVFSEFGRRAKQNASAGTDHGKGGVMFVLGGTVNGGVYGGEPALAEEALDDGDVPVKVDFRSAYAAAANFIGANPAELVGPGFDPLPLI
ncbi:DUF1501 domain-containing protein [Oceanithermus sp.]|uniref:DUF1501 domain-containing protein n=1 Tax=Oceanithermus sp. TaxID=2268145 RepID=UPI00260151B6|nr:DUF1501 domain-containing protein [Oceanithermus sp.]